MSNIFRIAHISDPHLSHQYYRENIKSFKLLLTNIINQGIDHVVISGDITSTGSEEDFLLTKMILDSKGLMDSKKLTVVPGNHDIFGSPHRAIDVLSFPQKIKNTNYTECVNLFNVTFASTFENAYLLNTNTFFPFLKLVGPFAIIGLNSTLPWSLMQNPLGTNGGIYFKELKGLKKLINSPILKYKIPVVVMHHHFNKIKQFECEKSNIWKWIESRTMKLYNKRKILKVFKALGIKYVLHGHVHRNEIYRRNEILFANGAGAVCDDPVRFLKYNLLEYSNDYHCIRVIQLKIPYQVSSTSQFYGLKHKLNKIPKYDLSPIIY